MEWTESLLQQAEESKELKIPSLKQSKNFLAH